MSTGPVEQAARSQLRAAGIKLGESALAAAAVQIARRLDSTQDAAKYASGMRELRQTLGELEDLRARSRPATVEATEAPKGDVVDELAERRDRPIA